MFQFFLNKYLISENSVKVAKIAMNYNSFKVFFNKKIQPLDVNIKLFI